MLDHTEQETESEETEEKKNTQQQQKAFKRCRQTLESYSPVPKYLVLLLHTGRGITDLPQR